MAASRIGGGPLPKTVRALRYAAGWLRPAIPAPMTATESGCSDIARTPSPDPGGRASRAVRRFRADSLAPKPSYGLKRFKAATIELSRRTVSRETGVVVLSSHEPERRPRLGDVAAAVGVSPASVSLVLRGVPGPSEATRVRVLEAAARLGYRPDRAASLLARRRSRLIGVMMDVRNPFHAQLVEDVHAAAELAGYDLVLSTVTRTRDEARAVETLLDSRCEALVLLGPEAPTARLAALDRRLPVVVVGRPVRSDGVDIVRAADDEGVAQAVDHLAGLGHRRITYVDGGDSGMGALRRRCYQHGMRRHGLADHAHLITGGNTETDGAGAAQTVLATEPRPP